MTPEQIEVGGYYSIDIGEPDVAQFRVKSSYGAYAFGAFVHDDKIIHKWLNTYLKPSTREAFNAAVDRVAARVKGE